MKYSGKICLFVFAVLMPFMSVVNGSEHILANIATDVDSDTYRLLVFSDEDDQVITKFVITNITNGHITKQDELGINEFIHEGIKCGPSGPVVFAKINAHNFNEEQGGLIIIDALYNILTGKRKRYELDLVKNKVGWGLYTKGRLITQILAKAKRVPIIGIVGAADLVMN